MADETEAGDSGRAALDARRVSVSMAVWSALEPHLETVINLDLNDIDENRQFAGIVLDVTNAVCAVATDDDDRIEQLLRDVDEAFDGRN